MLCEKCTPMFQSLAWGVHHKDIASLQDAADRGCYICQPLLEYALHTAGTLDNCMASPYRYRVYRTRRLHVDGVHIIIDMAILHNRTQVYKYWSLLVVPSSRITADLSIRDRKSISVVDACRITQKWMNDCLSQHEHCRKNIQPSTYPRRLLELGTSSMRLFQTADEKPSGSYAALSYCWGPNPSFLRLTASNLTKLQQGIAYSDLPIAFQEAINVLKGLSITYLWIDALCIIQSGEGSKEDWQSESAKMQDVYSKSIINISLSRAAHPNESCLAEYTFGKRIPPFQTQTSGLFDQSSTMCTVISHDHYKGALYDQPIGHRAWVLQERLLSPRVLSFGHGELFWDCIQRPNASEYFPDGLSSLASDDQLRKIFQFTDKAIPNISDKQELVSFWYRVVEEYTDRDLTFPERDKLVALSAIAKRMETAMEDIYLAGHFSKTLPLSLNWQVHTNFTKERRREGNPTRIIQTGNDGDRVPSWSWASMNGSLFIKPEDPDLQSLADTIDHQMFTVNQTSLLGLFIRAYCAEIKWLRGGPIMIGRPVAWAKLKDSLFVRIDDPADEPEAGTTYLMLALCHGKDSRTCEGLVVREAREDAEKLYQRIGHFKYFHSMTLAKSGVSIAGFEEEKRTVILV